MGRYLLRRLLIAIPSLLGISLVLFVVLALAPGDPFSERATNPNLPPEVALALRAKFGLDDPIYLRYLHWLNAMLHGDWGFSFVSRMNVDTLILQRLPTTLYVIGSVDLCIAVAGFLVMHFSWITDRGLNQGLSTPRRSVSFVGPCPSCRRQRRQQGRPGQTICNS